MATHYLSVNQGQKASIADNSGVVYGTSLPTADCVVVLGSNLPIASLSKQRAIDHLQSIINYINSDKTNIPWGTR